MAEKGQGKSLGGAKHRNAGTFTKERPGPGRGHKKPQAKWGFDPVADLLHAYSTDEAPGETEGQKAARKLLKDDYKTFMQMLLRAQGMQDAKVEAASTEVGPQEQRVGELIDRLLREWEEGQG